MNQTGFPERRQFTATILKGIAGSISALVFLFIVVAAPAAWGQEADPLNLAFEPAPGPELATKAAVTCGSNWCQGKVPDLVQGFVTFGDQGIEVYFITQPDLKATLQAFGCTDNFYLYSTKDNRYRHLNQLVAAMALDKTVRINFAVHPTRANACELTWLNFFTW